VPVTIYLAGGMNGLSDAEMHHWREYAKARLDRRFRISDPTVRDFRGEELVRGREIVEGDKAEILAADILLVNYPRPSTGTDMEIHYAWTLHKDIWVVVPPEYAPYMSPWLSYHSAHISQSMDWVTMRINQVYAYQHDEPAAV
jgi:hypothetical protein